MITGGIFGFISQIHSMAISSDQWQCGVYSQLHPLGESDVTM